MTMPFGKHHGLDTADLPDDYLMWLARRCELYGGLRSAVRRELRMRGYEPDDFEDDRRQAPPPPPPPPPPGDGVRVTRVDRALFTELVTAGFRALAMRYHPDRGGDAETMRRQLG